MKLISEKFCLEPNGHRIDFRTFSDGRRSVRVIATLSYCGEERRQIMRDKFVKTNGELSRFRSAVADELRSGYDFS